MRTRYAGLVVVVTLGSVALAPASSRPVRAFGRYAAIDALREAKLRGGGGLLGHGRERPSSGAEEQVNDRAYPRSYVDDRQALAARRAFDRVAGHGSGRWTALGPVTPNVAGEASQFFNPAPGVLNGPATQESGRVTALAIDPSCKDGRCRMWVATAGGGVWRTSDALAGHVSWSAPPDDLPTNAFGSLYYDAKRGVLYAGSGEPSGSGDSEAGLGLFKSTDFGEHWTLVPGSAPVATNRSIGAIATDPANPRVIYIGTDVARHGSASVNGGRRTPPNAPALGVYRSTDGGAHFVLQADLAAKAPPNPTPAATGSDWFQGGITRLEIDPNHPRVLYAGIFGYGVWRADQSASDPVWAQVFHTMNQSNFDTGEGDFFGDRTEFDLVDLGSRTRMYLGDSSDDWATDGDDSTPLAEAWRHDNVAAVGGATNGLLDNVAAGWIRLSDATNGTNGYLAYGWCQNGQCGYDSVVASPPGDADSVWYAGSMNYDELLAYDQFGTGAPPRSNGRAVIRSTNAGESAAQVTWQDMTAVVGSTKKPWDIRGGIHPDLRSIVFAEDGEQAFVGGDGGVVRVDVSDTSNKSAACSRRTWNYNTADPTATPVPLMPDDLTDCRRLLSATPRAITPLNDGLNTIQFQSVSFNPANPTGELLGGTQDNGTWSYTGSTTWFESVGGDGGQSGFDARHPLVRYHNYYDATPEVNFHGNDPRTWLNTYDPLQTTDENRSFYTPFIADPVTGGRAFTGLQHVWRTNDNGGKEQDLVANGCLAVSLDPFRENACGDWEPIGEDLTSDAFGDRGGQYVVATTRAPGDADTLWAGTRTGRLFVSGNADKAAADVHFFRIDTPDTPGRFVSGIAVDPKDPNHAWVSYSGYSAYAAGGHVYEVRYKPSTHTATFTDRSLNLGDQPVTGVATYGRNGDVFAATDFGVLRLAKGATQWVDAGLGLPHVAVYGLALSDRGRVLYAATHGRGAYVLPLP